MGSFSSKSSGAWETAGQVVWNEVGSPVAGDTVSIGAGHAITMGAAAACATLTIAATGSLSTWNGETSYDLAISGASEISGTLTLNDSAVTTTGITVKDGGTVAIMTSATVNTGALTVGDGASGLISFAAGGVLDQVGTVTINAGGVIGTAATAFEFDITGEVAVSAGTLIAPTAAGTMYVRAGSTWRTPTTYTHSSGIMTFLGSGTVTVANNSTQFYAVIVANFTTLAVGTYALTMAQNLTVGGGASGTISVDTGAVITVNGATSIPTNGILGTADKAYTIDLNGTLSCNGTVIAPNATGAFTVTGNWTCVTFTHSSGKVVFDGTNQTINGSHVWYSLDKHDASTARILTIDNTSTQTVEGQLDLYGGAGKLLTVKSDSAGNAFSLVLTGTKGTIQYLSVQDSDASGSDADVKPINPSNSTDSGGNIDWFPAQEAQVIVIS